MNPAVHIVPVVISALFWYGLYFLNKRKGWFRIGEIIFWDAIILIVVFLVWLKWF